MSTTRNKRVSIRSVVAGNIDPTTEEREAPLPVITQPVEVKKEQQTVIQTQEITQGQEVTPERVKTGFTLRKDLLKDVKRLAVEEETDINNLLEEGMRLVLESRKQTS